MSLVCNPIGTFYTQAKERYMLPRQPGVAAVSSGKIVLAQHQNFEQALEDLIGFEKIWILFWMHRNKNWKPKVMPPRGEQKRGLFSTRSPHRPNPIGLSCVSLKGIKDLTLLIEDHDLLDGTPILDIKPYIVYADAFADSKQGWLDEVQSDKEYQIIWDFKAEQQAIWIQKNGHPEFIQNVRECLSRNPIPTPNNRIKKIAENEYIWAFKTWRIHYFLQETIVTIVSIDSGYDQSTLEGKKISLWDDVPIHIEFLAKIW